MSCVSSDLMGSEHARGTQHLYPASFWKAWAVDHTGIQNFLLRMLARTSIAGRWVLGC